MDRFEAELVGGPYDGDAGVLRGLPPAELWAAPCPHQPEQVTWYGEWVQGAEHYTLEAFADGEALRYVFADIKDPNGLTIDEKERIPA
jgi:hypothetical protein